jgi:hypothetical protein
MTAVHDPLADTTAAEAPAGDRRAWRHALLIAAVAHVLSRLVVAAAAAAVAAARDPRPDSAARPILDVLTSWDGLWYLRIVRDGYPASVPPDITFNQVEARAAFFPLYPMVVRAADRLLPGGDVAAAIAVNLALGVTFVYLVGLLARRLFGVRVATRAMVLASVFPGSFVLSFTYSEAVMLALAALCLLLLLDHRWLLAGLVAAVCTAARPNAVAIAAACAWAALVAIKDDREWSALVAPALAPVGFVAFQLWLGWHADEPGVWFRVQNEAWDEGVSFGLTAIGNTIEFFLHPFGSATDALTALCVVAMGVGLWALWRMRLPGVLTVYTLVVLALMLLPDTVTARPRFLYTAFPLLIAFAAWWKADDEDGWGLVLAASGAGLFGVVTLYGLYAAIP